MFKHHPVSPPDPRGAAGESGENKPPVIEEKINSPVGESSDIKELLEKNLKWSQIIYEQNRKLNRKLFWIAAGSWLRVLIILIPLVAAVLYAPTLYRKFQDSYGSILQSFTAGRVNPSSADGLLKILPLNDSQREQLKTILK